MKYYYMSSNPNEYDLEQAFKELEFIDWSNPRHTKFEKGNIVLIYESKGNKSEEGRIKYVAQVTDPKISPQDTLKNDTKYYKLSKEKSKLPTADSYIRIKPLLELPVNISSMLKGSDLNNVKYKETGVNFNPTGKLQIKTPLLEYIKKVLAPLNIEDQCNQIQNPNSTTDSAGTSHNENKLNSMINKYVKVLPDRLKQQNNGYWYTLSYFHSNKVSIDDKKFFSIFKLALDKIPDEIKNASFIETLANKDLEKTQEIFKELLSDTFSLERNYLTIKNSIKDMAKALVPSTNRSLEQIKYMTSYLWLMHPSYYYIYNDKIIEKNCQYFGINRKYNQYNHDVDIEKITEQIQIYDSIKSKLTSNDIVMQELNKYDEINKIDPNHNTLTIDFMYFTYNEITNGTISTSNSQEIKLMNNSNIEYVTGGQNIIVYGAPGVGKSFYVDSIVEGKSYERVVFHNEYTYFDFVGAYKPVPVFKKTHDVFVDTTGNSAMLPGTPYINYEFIPGPFIETLIRAYKAPGEMHYLIIEELNRANAAAVFGDIFQLLDRDESGRSKYTIKPSRELRDYLSSQEVNLKELANDFRIPSNMTIYATMNSADQGVNYMDSAFKRRWKYYYIPINEKEIDKNITIEYAEGQYSYRDFLTELNKLLKKNKIDEDRLIGPWFLNINGVSTISNADIQKLNLYLWDDIFRHIRPEIFKNISTLNDLNNNFAKNDVLNIKNDLEEIEQAKEK